MSRTEDLGFSANVVIPVCKPRANLGIGVLVSYAAGVDLCKICEVALLVGSHIVSQPQKPVDSHLTGGLGICWQLSCVSDTAMEHGICWGKGSRIIISAIYPGRRTALVTFHVVAHL